MIDPATLRTIAAARLQDAQTLLTNGRHDGANYLCGYAIELVLKARICDTLNWLGYPEESKDFQNLLSFRTHDLNILLRLSGRESAIIQQYLAEWSIVKNWKPEMRYKRIGHVAPNDAQAFIQAATTLTQQI